MKYLKKYNEDAKYIYITSDSVLGELLGPGPDGKCYICDEPLSKRFVEISSSLYKYIKNLKSK